MIETVNKVIDRVEAFAMITLMFIATLIAIVQVIARYVFSNSLYWSEETVLYSLIIMSFIAGSMGVRYSAHICVEVLDAMAGPKTSKILKYLSAILGGIFAFTLFYYGGRLFLNTLSLGQLSPALRVPVAYIYLVIPVSGLFMFMRYLLILKTLLQNKEFEEFQPLSMTISPI